MKVLAALIAVVFLQIAGCSDRSDDRDQVPEPLFEVFSPRGLRVSIPDFRDVKSVEFYLNVPGHPDALTHHVNRTSGNRWIYWNPDVVLHLYDKVQYKIMVLHGDLYCRREGTHVVQQVSPLSGLSNDTDCAEEQGQRIISGFPSLGDVEDRHRGMISTGKASSLKSSYSTLKNSELKPITKSSMSTTSGTFYVKPSGVMEATGYKSGSSFDSTKREGEQWQHYKSELTAEELENMKNLYGSGFPDFPHLGGNLFPTRGNVYQKSYMSSESKSFPAGYHAVAYQESPLATHKFHQTHKTHESSSFTHSKPVFQYHYGDSVGGGSVAESSRQSEKLYKLEPFNKLPDPLPPQGTIVKTTEFVREEHTVPVGEVSRLHVDRETHSDAVPQKIVQVSQSGEFSTHDQEIIKPVLAKLPGGSGRGDQMEYSSGDLETVDGRQDYRSRHYLGNIFTSVKTTKVKSPRECDLVPGLDYSPTGNVREVEKYAYELGCLATLAESTTKEEIALLKQRNGELGRKLELLEHEVKRLMSNCNCYE